VRRRIFLDESGVNLSMTRTYAWAPSNERAIGHVPRNWGDSVTVVAAIAPSGLMAPLVFSGAMDSETFQQYVEYVLLPELQPGDVVYMDNLGAHKSPRIAELFASVGAEVAYLPPYSPDFNPIEKAWSKVKSILRSLAARTYDDLVAAMKTAMLAVTAKDSRGWYRNAGFCD